MSYSNRVNFHGYYSSFIHYFSICFSLLSTLSTHNFLFQPCILFSLPPLYRFIFPSVHWSHLSPTISPPISPQATNLTLTNLTHHRYDLNRQTTLWRSLDGTISLARDPKTMSWRSSQGRDVWVLMGIDLWVLIGLMLAGILMGRLNILIGGFLILIGLFFLVHWWVLMILLPIGWVMIWLD